MAEEGPEPRIDSTAPLETQWGVAFHFAPAPLTHHPLTLTEIPRSLLCPTWLRGSPDRLPAQLRAFCPHMEKGMTEDEMSGWHHPLDGQEFEQAPEAGDQQGSLACCSLWGYKQSDMTERLN